MAWLPYVTAEYVTATGDISILEEPVPFLKGPPLLVDEHARYAEYEVSALPAPLFEHCRRALERAVTSGAHGLPLMGDGDWNNENQPRRLRGRGESVWLGWFLCATMDRFASLSTRRGDGVGALHWRARAESLRATVKGIAWDGAWYLRAFHDDGSLVGSAKSLECRIDSIARSWAVLSERESVPCDARTRAAVGAAEAQASVRDTNRLVLLSGHPFDSTPHDPGYVRAYPPGFARMGGSARRAPHGLASRMPLSATESEPSKSSSPQPDTSRARWRNPHGTALSLTRSRETFIAVPHGWVAGAGPGTRGRPPGCGVWVSSKVSAFVRRKGGSAIWSPAFLLSVGPVRGVGAARGRVHPRRRREPESCGGRDRNHDARRVRPSPRTVSSSQLALPGTHEVRVRLGPGAASADSCRREPRKRPLATTKLRPT